MRYLAIAMILIFGSHMSWTQDTSNGAWESWMSMAIQYQPNKKWQFSLEEQLRLDENMSSVDQYFTELDAEYKLFKGTRLGFSGRYIRNNDNNGKIQGYENHRRLAFFVKQENDIGRFKVDYRLQYQTKDEIKVSGTDGNGAINTMRLKLAGRYNIRNWKLDPKLSAEIFSPVDDISNLSKLRVGISTNYKISKNWSLSAFIRMEKSLNSIDDERANIIGFRARIKI